MPNKFVKVAPSWESVGKFKGGVLRLRENRGKLLWRERGKRRSSSCCQLPTRTQNEQVSKSGRREKSQRREEKKRHQLVIRRSPSSSLLRFLHLLSSQFFGLWDYVIEVDEQREEAAEESFNGKKAEFFIPYPIFLTPGFTKLKVSSMLGT